MRITCAIYFKLGLRMKNIRTQMEQKNKSRLSHYRIVLLSGSVNADGENRWKNNDSLSQFLVFVRWQRANNNTNYI